MTKLKILGAGLTVGLVLGLAVAASYNPIFQKRPETAEPVLLETPAVIRGNLMLDFGDGSVKTYELTPEENTVMGLLKAAAEENGFEINYSDSEFGVFVKAIAGVENTTEKFWQFWVNNKFADKAADRYELKNGDIIVEWKFIRSQF
ncbi:MAG: DUF4430 domain-containing protein [bacterium]